MHVTGDKWDADILIDNESESSSIFTTSLQQLFTHIMKGVGFTINSDPLTFKLHWQLSEFTTAG